MSDHDLMEMYPAAPGRREPSVGEPPGAVRIGPLTPFPAEAGPAPRASLIPARQRLRVLISLIVLLVLLAVNLAIGSGKLQFEKVVSGSMEPTLRIGDVILADANAAVERYDIVALTDPADPESKLVKRVIGMPGDRVEVRDGILYVNGEEQYSEFVTSNLVQWRDVRVNVPLDAVFVLGDNRNNSFDSLNFGPVPFDKIRGVVWMIVWPPASWGRPQAFD